MGKIHVLRDFPVFYKGRETADEWRAQRGSAQDTEWDAMETMALRGWRNLIPSY